MKYLLFTYPNCSRCKELKKYLGETDLEGQECSLILKESKLQIREFLSILKRDDRGAIIIPTLVLQENGKAVALLNNHKELEHWLKSRA